MYIHKHILKVLKHISSRPDHELFCWSACISSVDYSVHRPINPFILINRVVRGRHGIEPNTGLNPFLRIAFNVFVCIKLIISLTFFI